MTENKPPVLTGERVLLRHPRIDDNGSFLAFVRDNRQYHRPWVYPPADSEAFARFVARSYTQRDRAYLVLERTSGQIAGVIDISQIIHGALQSAFLGYYGSARLAGLGYMGDAVRIVVRHAFEELELHRLEANIQPDNIASIRLVENCGFRKEGLSPRYLKIGGRWQDHERWAILADD
jgi:ribosomal-protein-alanine N-acetyltransferase